MSESVPYSPTPGLPVRLADRIRGESHAAQGRVVSIGIGGVDGSRTLKRCPDRAIAAGGARTMSVSRHSAPGPRTGPGKAVARQRGLAYVTVGSARFAHWGNPCFESARRQAREFGYSLMHVGIGDTHALDDELGRQLTQSGIAGVVVESRSSLAGPWLTISRVTEDSNLSPIRRIGVDLSGNTRLAVRRIRMAGYARIGLVIPPDWDRSPECENGCICGFLAEMLKTSTEVTIPTLLCPDAFATGVLPEEVSAFASWYDRHRPEVILGHASFALSALRAMDLDVPRDVSFVDLDVRGSPLAGIKEDYGMLGSVAMGALISSVRDGTGRGPRPSSTTVVPGVWQDGGSLPDRRML